MFSNSASTVTSMALSEWEWAFSFSPKVVIIVRKRAFFVPVDQEIYLCPFISGSSFGPVFPNSFFRYVSGSLSNFIRLNGLPFALRSSSTSRLFCNLCISPMESGDSCSTSATSSCFRHRTPRRIKTQVRMGDIFPFMTLME